MAEWSVTGTERDVLLATKLYLPGLRPGQVSRPRLLARLRRALDVPSKLGAANRTEAVARARELNLIP
jgi:ATP/maltotriose-dependent transcriptional regulator MalT